MLLLPEKKGEKIGQMLLAAARITLTDSAGLAFSIFDPSKIIELEQFKQQPNE